jgi:hypothetical protein
MGGINKRITSRLALGKNVRPDPKKWFRCDSRGRAPIQQA